jgi:hypothetical protein
LQKNISEKERLPEGFSPELTYLKTAVERAVFRSGSSLSAVQSSLCYSRETHPECFRDSDSHGCLTLHFAKNGTERRAKSLKPTPPTAEYRIKVEAKALKKPYNDDFVQICMHLTASSQSV